MYGDFCRLLKLVARQQEYLWIHQSWLDTTWNFNLPIKYFNLPIKYFTIEICNHTHVSKGQMEHLTEYNAVPLPIRFANGLPTQQHNII